MCLSFGSSGARGALLGAGLTRSLVCAAVIALAAATSALAQTQSTSPPPDTSGSSPPGQDQSKSSTAVKPLVVTGKAPDYRRDADKRSYSISSDLNAAHGSIGDALRDVPSVDVDLQGNVTLRGDSNVTIMVDGQPSSLFQGPNRADVLQQLPADQYERVEVMTNPSAAYSPEGTGGIINLITRKAHKTPPTATLSGTVATGDQYRASANGNWSVGKLSLTGSLTVGRTHYDGTSDNVETIQDPASGDTAMVTAPGVNTQSYRSAEANGEASYQLDGATRLTESLGDFWFGGRFPFSGQYRSSALTGPLALDYDTSDNEALKLTGLFSNTALRHTFGGDDQHYASLNLSLQSSDFSSDSPQSFAYSLPAQPNLFQDIRSDSPNDSLDLQGEYHGPLPGAAKLVAGYELSINHEAQDRDGRLGTDAADAVASPLLTDRFSGDQTVNSLYATYDRPFGKLDVEPGLRLEEVNVATDDTTVGVRGRAGYFEAYPTLELAYQLDAANRLTANFSRRVDRPDVQQLSPARTENDPLSFWQGNPSLKPSITDAYEVPYEYNGKSLNVLASLWLKDKGDLISATTENLGDGVLLTTPENVGHDRDVGAELTGKDQLTKALSVSATIDAKWDRLEDPVSVIGGVRSGLSTRGTLKLNWSPTPNDFIQVDAHATGRTLTPQGYMTPHAVLNLGYRRRLTDRISAEVRINDAFDSERSTTVTETPTLSQRSTYDPRQRAAFFTLSYTFGPVVKQATKDFDFSGGGGPGGGPH